MLSNANTPMSSWNKQFEIRLRFVRFLSKIGLVEAGGNYAIVQRRIQELNLNKRHFTGRGWRKDSGVSTRLSKPIAELLVNGSNFQSFKLKRRLLSEGFKEARCEMCSGVQWLDRPIPLELDHINGINTDNRLKNLRLLCPNCHALTETYRGKKRAKCRDETAPF